MADCPLSGEECKREDCMFWVRDKFGQVGTCAVARIAKEIGDGR